MHAIAPVDCSHVSAETRSLIAATTRIPTTIKGTCPAPDPATDSATDPATDPLADTHALGETIASLAAGIHAATFRLLTLLRAFDERLGWNGAGATLNDLAKVRVYVKRPEDYAKCRAVCERRLGATPAIYAQADVCRPNLLVEIEVTAVVIDD